MHLNVLVFALSLVTIAALPIHRQISGPETHHPDLLSNQAVEKSDRSKDVNAAYKSHMQSVNLYSGHDLQGNPMMEEMHRKLSAESERLRARLRHELHKLQGRLSPGQAQPGASSASLRERLAPLTQQLQSALLSGVQDLSTELSLYLGGVEAAEVTEGAEVTEVVEARYHREVQWVSETLDRGRARMTRVIGDFQSRMFDAAREARGNGGVEARRAQETTSRLGHEVRLLHLEVLGNVGAVKAELVALLVSGRPFRDEMAASLERFCQDAHLQNQVFQARVEGLVLGSGANPETPGEPSPSSAEPRKEVGLQEDFSVRLSALIQDILHSVQ